MVDKLGEALSNYLTRYIDKITATNCLEFGLVYSLRVRGRCKGWKMRSNRSYKLNLNCRGIAQFENYPWQFYFVCFLYFIY